MIVNNGKIKKLWWTKLINTILWPTRWGLVKDEYDNSWHIYSTKGYHYTLYNVKQKNAPPFTGQSVNIDTLLDNHFI